MAKSNWEYVTVALGAASSAEPDKPGSALNAYGKQGWEAVGLATLTDGQTAVLMKRALARRLGGSRM